MRSYSSVSLAVVVVGLMALGARGCGVWAETDAATYEEGAEAVATLHNDTADTAFLAGCGGYFLQKLEGGTWIDIGPFVVCVWEGIAQPVEAGGAFSASFLVPEKAGTYRIHFPVSFGCIEGKPLSEAECDGMKDVYTPSFKVTQALPETCEEWRALYDAQAANVTACASPDECAALPGTSCGCTRNLVVNKDADLTTFWQIYKDMGQAGCGIITTCDCPPADGYLCQDGQCAWNYL